MKETLVVLTAAGSGLRLGEDLPKALVRIGAKTILGWALTGLTQAANIGRVCVTVPADFAANFDNEVASLELPFPVTSVSGGQTRQRSVWQGLQELEPYAFGDTPVLIHDAARCFTPANLINRVAQNVGAGSRAVIPGLPVTDTVKEVTPGELAPVVSTLNRTNLRTIQTPQGFQWETLWQAHTQFYSDGDDEATAAPDDANLVERLGLRTFVCPGDPQAFKITTRADLKYAEAILEP